MHMQQSRARVSVRTFRAEPGDRGVKELIAQPPAQSSSIRVEIAIRFHTLMVAIANTRLPIPLSPKNA